MSGPKTASYSLETAAMLRAALAARVVDLKIQATRLEARCQRLAELTRCEGEQEIALPSAPADHGADVDSAASAWGEYVRQLDVRLAELEARWERQWDQREGQAAPSRAMTFAADVTPDLEAVFTQYLAVRQAEREAAEQGARREKIARMLANLPTGEVTPEIIARQERIAALAREVMLAETPTRAELLSHELSREIQLLRGAVESAKRDAEQAAEWLRQLAVAESLAGEGGAGDVRDLRTRLQAVAAGRSPLDATTREAAKRSAARIESALREQETRLAAQVLEQSLRDLGYQVEAVSETLFAEGGMLHFQRSGWGAYQVRLRVNADEKRFNFNVVRARREGAAGDADQQKRQDFIAEERWCAEFPRLLASLNACGMPLGVTRLLAAGELPVQEVDAERLPRFASEPEPMRRNAPKRLDLPKETP